MARIRYSQEVRHSALRQIIENNASAKSVAQQIGCNVNSVLGWLRRYRQSLNVIDHKSEPTFVPVHLIDQEHNANNQIEMTLPNGLTLKITNATPEFIARIVREIASC